MNNKQFDEVERLLERRGDNRACPTCGKKPIEVAPGVEEWAPSTYRLNDADHKCNCAEQSTLLRHYLLAHIPDSYTRLGRTDYVGDPKAWTAADEYLDNWENVKRQGLGLGFYSRAMGTGKTFISTYIGRELVKRGESVYYINFRTLVSLYDAPRESREHEEERIRNDRVLILDEIAKPVSEAQRSFYAEKFEELIRWRTDYGFITIMTTNLTPDELDNLYPRTYSLLAAKQKHIQIAGGDMRRDGIFAINELLALNSEIRPLS